MVNSILFLGGDSLHITFTRFTRWILPPKNYTPNFIDITIDHTKSWLVETEAPVMSANERPNREDVWGSENWRHKTFRSAQRLLSGKICSNLSTLPETNITPKNRPSQKETSVPTIHFQVRAVSFRGCRWFQWFFDFHPNFFGGCNDPIRWEYFSNGLKAPTN